MKKILIATTALVGTAGVAAAEITFGGFGRVGIGYTEDAVNEVTGESQELRIEQRFRLTITGVAETDGGVKVEGRFRVETNEDADNSLPGSGGFGAAGFAVSAGGFRLDVGNVSDVIDSGDHFKWSSDVGLTGFANQNNAFDFGFVGGFGAGDADTTTIKALYEVGDFSVSASYSNDSAELLENDGTTVGNATDVEEFQLGFGYSFGDYQVGAALGSVDDGATTNDFWVIGFGGDIGAFGFSVIVGDEDSADEVAYGLAVDYDISAATTIKFTASDGGADGDDAAFGIGFTHDLGGSVKLAGGIGQETDGLTRADLGVSFDF